MATRVGALPGPRPLSRDVSSPITTPLLDNRSGKSLERSAPSRIELLGVIRASSFAPWQPCTVDPGRIRELALRPRPQAQQDILSTPFGATRTAQGGPGDGHEAVGDVVEIDDAAAHDFSFLLPGQGPNSPFGSPATPLPKRGPWLCVPASRRGCLSRGASAPLTCRLPRANDHVKVSSLSPDQASPYMLLVENHGQFQCNPL